MKNIHLVLLAVVLLAVPFAAQAKTCTQISCYYTLDPTFSAGGTDWTEVGSVNYTTTSTCSSNDVAELSPGEAVYQDFYVDGDFTSYAAHFDAYILNSGNNWYDQITFTVTNLDTNVSESVTLNDLSYDNTCTDTSLPLSNNYDYANVRIKVSVAGGLAIRTWQTDNVFFWARHY